MGLKIDVIGREQGAWIFSAVRNLHFRPLVVRNFTLRTGNGADELLYILAPFGNGVGVIPLLD